MNTPATASGLGRIRTRWAAIGAAIAITAGAGGIGLVSAAPGPASTFSAVNPERVLDTRTDLGLTGPLVSATSRDLMVTGTINTPNGSQVVVPAGATAVALNVTVVNPEAAGFLSIRPADATGSITTSNLNFDTGDIVPNAVTVALPTTGPDAGAIELTYDAFGNTGPTTNVLIDVTGFFVAGGGGDAPGPQGPQGEQGPPGAQGPQGSPGPAGFSTVIRGSDGSVDIGDGPELTLPLTAGAWLISATATLDNDDGSSDRGWCNLFLDDTRLDRIERVYLGADFDPGSMVPFAVQGVGTATGASTARLDCRLTDGPDSGFTTTGDLLDVEIIAVPVGSIIDL